MTSTLRQRRYETRSNTPSVNSGDDNILDLTNDGNSDEEPYSPDNKKSMKNDFADFQIIKSEPLNKDELISLVITVSCVPYMLIILYTVFPTITMICAAPWFLIVYIMKTYHTYQLPLKLSTFKSMGSIMYHRSKDYMLTAYRNI